MRNQSTFMSVSYTHLDVYKRQDKICENATKHAIAAAKEAGALISFDPNLRKPLWKSMDDAKEKISCCLLYTSRCV